MIKTRVASARSTITLIIVFITVANTGCSSTNTYRSKIEASRAADSHRAKSGSRKEAYVVKEIRRTRIPNDTAIQEKTDKLLASQKKRYADQIAACSDFKEGTLWTEKLRSDRKSNLPWGWAKYLDLGSAINAVEIKGCFSSAEQIKPFKLDDSDRRWLLPPRFIDGTRVVEITKYKDVANIVCRHEDVSRQWVCWNTKGKEKYKYFKY